MTENLEIILSDNEIEAIINGETIKQALPNGNTVNVRQSYGKDVLAPVMNRRNKVIDTEVNTVMNKHYANAMLNSARREGF